MKSVQTAENDSAAIMQVHHPGLIIIAQILMKVWTGRKAQELVLNLQENTKRIKMSRVLSIRLSNSQLLAIFDILEARGLDRSTKLTTNIVNLLDIIIGMELEAGTIDFENDSSTALNKLSEKILLVGKTHIAKQKQTLQTLPKTELLKATRKNVEKKEDEFDPTPPDLSVYVPVTTDIEMEQDNIQNLNNNYPVEETLTEAEEMAELEDLIEQQLAELELENEINLRSKLNSVQPSTSVTVLETPKIEQNLRALNKDDKRLEKDKLYKEGDEITKESLRVIYYNLPQDLWSSVIAESLLEKFLKQINKEEK